MFTSYDRICRALESKTLSSEWPKIIDERMSSPWNGLEVSGHIPLFDCWNASRVLDTEFSRAGFYVWGSWSGTRARLQYIGIAHGYTLWKRIERRYVGSENAGRDQWAEMTFARKHGDRLVELPDDFSPRRPFDPGKFVANAIPLPHKSRYSRIARAERYAKNGLENMWLFPIPPRKDATKAHLEAIEKCLIQLTNANLFRASASPLVNVVHARADTNPCLPNELQLGYGKWINGAWWKAT